MKNSLQNIFVSITFTALLFLSYNLYKSYSFKHQPLPKSFQNRLHIKEQEVLNNMHRHFGITLNIPVIVTDKIPGRLYGLTSYENNQIRIYLNKKVMQESMDYMVDSVIAHEYAHALMFALGYKNEQHSARWQKACQLLGGKDCHQYVNSQEIILSKMPFK